MPTTDETIDVDVFAAPILQERPWAVFAACRDADPDLFFSNDRHAEARALAICEICPVQEDCLEHALGARERFGVWGGLTEKARRAFARRS
jgi:WhiB family redox-sensing transcriptional regulator